MLCVYKPLSILSGNLKDNGLGVRVGLRLGLGLSLSFLGCIFFSFLNFQSSPILFNLLGNTQAACWACIVTIGASPHYSFFSFGL